MAPDILIAWRPDRPLLEYPPRMHARPHRFALLLPLSAALWGCSENNLVKKDDGEDVEFDDVSPNILVDPLSVDFGSVLAGASAAATLSISNVGDDTLTLDTLRLGSADSALTFTEITSPLLLAGDSVATVVTWTPSTSGPLSNTLDITSNDPDEPLIVVPLSGSTPGGNLTVTPDLHDFGTLDVGASATVTLTVSNDGDGPITVSDTDYTAGDSDLHVLDLGALTALPATLEAGESAEVIVEYTPGEAGSDDGSFGFTSDDPDEPLIVVQQYGNAISTDPCMGLSKHVTLMLTADDAWDGWMDGTEFFGANSDTWSASDTLEWDMGCGDHTLALYATDVAHAVSGVIAVVWVDGAVRFVSGPTDWTIVDTPPPSDWTDITFDDSGWNVPQVCSTSSIWGASPQPFYDQGASWIWWTSSCSDLGEAWLRLNFTVP